MSHTYTGINSWANGAVLPDDNDDLTAASVNVPLEALFNNTKYLKNISSNNLFLDFGQSISYPAKESIYASNDTGDYDNGDTFASFLIGGYYTTVSFDVIEISVSFIIRNEFFGGSQNHPKYRLAYKFDSDTTVTPIIGAETNYDPPNFLNNQNMSCNLSCRFSIYNKPHTGGISIYLQCGQNNGENGNAVQLKGPIGGFINYYKFIA